MADKRAHVAAILTATAASDIFTQDLEDHQEDFQNFREANSRPATPPPQAEKAAPPPQPQPEPAAPAKTASSESPLGDGKNAFITAAQIEALYRVSQDLKFKPSDWPAIVKNTLGMKIESTVKMTRTQFQTLGGLIKKVQSGGGEVTFDRAALRFVVPPAMPRDPGQEG
jgi:hypothetical protein